MQHFVGYLNSVNCMKFGQSILGEIVKIVATRCHILRLKCTKFDFGWGFVTPRPRWGSYDAPTDPLAEFRGPTSTGRKGNLGEEEQGRREGREEKIRHCVSATVERDRRLWLYASGATEIAGVDKSARSKLQGVENAGVENAVPSMKGESTGVSVKINVFFSFICRKQ